MEKEQLFTYVLVYEMFLNVAKVFDSDDKNREYQKFQLKKAFYVLVPGACISLFVRLSVYFVHGSRFRFLAFLVLQRLVLRLRSLTSSNCNRLSIIKIWIRGTGYLVRT